MPPIVQTILLLIASNVFMTFAWYGHLRDLAARPAWIAILVSWGIALCSGVRRPLQQRRRAVPA